MSIMKRRKTYIVGSTVFLALAAVMLAVFVWHETRALVAVAEQTQTATKTTPETQPPGPTLPLMDFSDLLDKNPDVVGRLVIEGIGLDYPVVQGSDNKHYLTHTAQGKYNARGAIFLDYRHRRDFSNFKSVIYGHHTKSEAMFGKLEYLRDPETFDRVTEATLYTPERTWRMEIFASALTRWDSQFYHYVFLSQSSREKHLDVLRKEALCWRDIGLTTEDRIVVLSTCSYEYEGARTVVLARLAG